MTGRFAVGLDVGPLFGRQTGIGQFVAMLRSELELRDDLTVVPYALSARAQLPDGVRRLPFPARPTLESWALTGRPRVDWALGRVDVIHGTNYVVPPSAAERVVSVHDTNIFTAPHLVSPVARRFAPIIHRAVASGAWVHTISHAVADQLQEILNTDRVRVVYLAAGAQVGASANRAKNTFILAVGTRETRKNYPRLISAFGMVAQDTPDLGLVIAGQPGSDDPAISVALDALPTAIRARVELLGFIDDKTRTRLYAEASLLALVSLDEGFGIPLVEAMAAGLPTVVAAVGALSEVADGASALVNPLSVVDIADGIRSVSSDDRLRESMIERGLVRSAVFSWANTASGLVDLYRTVLAAR